MPVHCASSLPASCQDQGSGDLDWGGLHKLTKTSWVRSCLNPIPLHPEPVMPSAQYGMQGFARTCLLAQRLRHDPATKLRREGVDYDEVLSRALKGIANFGVKCLGLLRFSVKSSVRKIRMIRPSSTKPFFDTLVDDSSSNLKTGHNPHKLGLRFRA